MRLELATLRFTTKRSFAFLVAVTYWLYEDLAPRARFELATLRLTAELVEILKCFIVCRLPGNTADFQSLSRATWATIWLGTDPIAPAVAVSKWILNHL